MRKILFRIEQTLKIKNRTKTSNKQLFHNVQMNISQKCRTSKNLEKNQTKVKIFRL